MIYDPGYLLPWLRPIWKATDYARGRRLVAMLLEWTPAYEQYERKLPTEAREKLLQASARTLDRLLQPLRVRRTNRSLTRPGSVLRHHFQHQPDLRITPIEKIRLPLKSRDELPPILAGLQ